MFELTIKNEVYQFNFGMGFLREVNKRVIAKGESNTNATKNIGLQYMIGGIMDFDVEALVDVLEAANKGQNPRVTRVLLDSYIDDESTDIDALFKDVLDFLSNANATKKTVAMLKEMVEKERAKAANAENAEK